MAKILISGGSGLIGKAITQLLIQHQHEVVWLSREKGSWNGIQKYKWDWTNNEIDKSAFKGVDILINLAGAGIIDKAWSDAYKKEIIDSRVKSSELLFSCMQKNNIHLKTFIGASAVGYYGSQISEMLVDESRQAGSDFMAQACVKWEDSYLPFSNNAQQCVVFRIGIVLAKEGGALQKMALPFRLGLGAALASGKQYLPWIHIEDLAQLFLYAIDHPKVEGTLNAVSSEIINNSEFSSALAKSLKRPYFLPNVPAFILKLVLGERHVAITSGLKISNQKIRTLGFEFTFPTIEKALISLNRATAN